MKKKFLVVALMAALSTVGYANSDLALQVESNSADINRIDKQVGANAGQIVEIGKQLQEQIKNNEGQKEEIGKLTQQVESNSADVNRIDKQVGANAGAIDELSGKVEAVEKENERVNAEQDAAIAKGDRIDKVQNQQIGALQTENVEQNNKIEALDKNKVNKADQEKVDNAQDGKIQANTDKITALENNFAQYDGRLSGLEKKVDHLDDKMNKGLSLMAAMNAVDFQNVQTGEMALGAGIGHYGNAQSVALGVAYAPVEDLTVNAKYSITAGDPDSFAVGAGATYKFKVGR